MNAIILAAGKGVRLLPNTKNVPKGMLKLFNETLIERQIKNLLCYSNSEIY